MAGRSHPGFSGLPRHSVVSALHLFCCNIAHARLLESYMNFFQVFDSEKRAYRIKDKADKLRLIVSKQIFRNAVWNISLIEEHVRYVRECCHRLWYRMRLLGTQLRGHHRLLVSVFCAWQ